MLAVGMGHALLTELQRQARRRGIGGWATQDTINTVLLASWAGGALTATLLAVAPATVRIVGLLLTFAYAVSCAYFVAERWRTVNTDDGTPPPAEPAHRDDAPRDDAHRDNAHRDNAHREENHDKARREAVIESAARLEEAFETAETPVPGGKPQQEPTTAPKQGFSAETEDTGAREPGPDAGMPAPRERTPEQTRPEVPAETS
jgi:hypothetical protein